ncbi:hypothetical protein DFP72DRAFT_1125287 [Ephemerocybe angulata]|uniref:Uncharacterized protein n=1 Tax=Ephemerocybe angulata TaxID=980116 RepID=A0A8H6HY04_9AGAR|nr:hypothetical protein DFP72DRAFT_1125287 [Tulosesus angulatus]
MSGSAVQQKNRRRRPKSHRTVNNLDPKSLSISDIVDLHGIKNPDVIFGTTALQISYYPEAPFPPHSRGFLYLHKRPGLPAGAGEIRFRVVDFGSTSQSAADLFASGMDLLEHAGRRPWQIHMLQLYTTRQYDPIRRLLLSSGLIGEARYREAEQRVSAVDLKKIGISTILDTISDTFVIQLPIMTLKLAFIHDECIVPADAMAYRLHWRDRPENVEGPWRLYRGGRSIMILLLVLKMSELTQVCVLGSAVVRYELKKAETNKMFHGAKQGEVVLVLRILELLDPVGPDGVPYRLSEGGELVQGTSPGRYWSMRLDRARKRGIITPSSLKILEELYLRGSASIEAHTGTSGTR